MHSLDQNILGSDNEYSFIVTENQIFAVTNDDAIEIVKYDMSPVQKGSNKNTSYAPDEYDSYDVLELVQEFGTLKQTSSATTIPLTSSSSRAIIEVVATVPSYTQAPYSNWCWAASAWCVGETVNTEKSFSVEDCVTHCGKVEGDGGNDGDQVDILENMYELSPEKHGILSESDIETLIGTKDDPFIMNCYSDDIDALGHSVTCYAYNNSYSPIRLAVMDTLVGSGTNWRWMVTSGTTYKITSAGTTYTYDNSVTPNGI